MDVALVMLSQDGAAKTFPLPAGNTTVGRREDCDLRIPLADVSRQHCKFVVDGDYVRIEDLGSANGTTVNGKKVALVVLRAGDRVKLGPVVFVVQIDGQPKEEDVALSDAAEKPISSLDEIDDILLGGDDDEIKLEDDSGEHKSL